MSFCQQISYISPGAPARRRKATGSEAFMRPEIGFTPRWFSEKLLIDFGERWHHDVNYRRETILLMRDELKRHFPGTSVGQIDEPERPVDLLTGLFGGNMTGFTTSPSRLLRNPGQNLLSRSMSIYRLPFRKPSSKFVRLRAICFIHGSWGLGVHPAKCTFRVATSMANSK